jgi:NTE family protein
VLGLNWGKLSLEPDRVYEDFVPLVVTPIRRMAGKTIDRSAVITGSLLPGTISQEIAEAYRNHLFEHATLRDLPADDHGPRFIFNATNVQTGALWRFSRPYMGDWKVGRIENPVVELAVAVGASSAFPPFLSPVTLDLEPYDFNLPGEEDLEDDAYRSDVILTDGGVYDNLGLETAWKRFKTILVSDAGGQMKPEPEPAHDWARHSYRVLNIIDSQVRALRKRQLIDSYRGDREGAYWGIRTNIDNYGLDNALPCPEERTLKLANTPTRLKRLNKRRQEQLINWGYAVTDAAIRKHVNPDLAPTEKFPYPESEV